MPILLQSATLMSHHGTACSSKSIIWVYLKKISVFFVNNPDPTGKTANLHPYYCGLISGPSIATWIFSILLIEIDVLSFIRRLVQKRGN